MAKHSNSNWTFIALNIPLTKSTTAQDSQPNSASRAQKGGQAQRTPGDY